MKHHTNVRYNQHMLERQCYPIQPQFRQSQFSTVQWEEIQQFSVLAAVQSLIVDVFGFVVNFDVHRMNVAMF